MQTLVPVKVTFDLERAHDVTGESSGGTAGNFLRINQEKQKITKKLFLLFKT